MKKYQRHVEKEIKVLSQLDNYRSIPKAAMIRLIKSLLPDGAKVNGEAVDVLHEEAEAWMSQTHRFGAITELCSGHLSERHRRAHAAACGCAEPVRIALIFLFPRVTCTWYA